MPYLVVPDANAKDSLAGAVFYPDAEPGDTLTGLSNGTAYRVYAVTEGPTVTPLGLGSPYQPDMTTGRIAPITTSFGGRPNVTPATYYFDGHDELASMAMGA